MRIHQSFRRQAALVGCCVVGFGAMVSAQAGSATYDFNSAPPADLNFVGNAVWRGGPFPSDTIGPNSDARDDGGVGGSGYMALFDSIGSQHASVLIPDFDKGLVVKAFTFEVDLRVGNATGNGGRPADGFSISYARGNDPVVLDLAQEPPVDNINNFSLAGAPENGTKTGLAISFDTWTGNAQPDGGVDIEGIMINLDGKVVPVNGARGIPMPNRNMADCNDATSMQTGAWNVNGLENGSTEGLCWAHLKVELNEDGQVTVTWKGTVIADKIPTGFAPSAGRIVFSGRTGGANENTHIDNLKITTIPSDKALYGGGTGDAAGYTLSISDSGGSVVDPATIKVKIDDVDATPTSVTKVDATTTIRITTAPNYLVSGSVHKTEVRFSDTNGSANLGGVKQVTVNKYADLLPTMAVTGVSTAAANRGFLLRTWYVAGPDGTALGDLANTNERSDQELFGELGVNQIDNPADLTQTIPGTSNKYAKEPDYLNHEETATSAGMFSDIATDPQRQATEKQIPGITGALNNLACEALFFVQFPAGGMYTFGCNSDDGFRLNAGKNPLDRFNVDGIMLGEFAGGRGTDANNPETLFDVLVREPGIYPVRFTFEEGGGGTSFELYQKLADGTFALVNDTTRAPSVVKAFWDGPRTARAYISKVVPGVGSITATYVGTPLEITITDDGTTVVDGSVKLTFNGAAVTPTVTKSGKNTVVKYAPTCWLAGANAVNIQYAESGGGSRDQSFNVTIAPAASALPANSFTIEAEHFDNNGQPAAGITGNGYTGDEYRGLSAKHDIDYHQDGNEPSQDGAYRSTIAGGLSPNVPMDAQQDASPNLDTARPGFDVTTNYKIGWAASGEWYNYTRTIPAGVYTAFAASSVDPAGTVGGDLALVTAGAGTTSQTVKTLATLRGPAPGGWGNNGLASAVDTLGYQRYFKLPGGKVTVRYTTQGGDFDWFTIAPVSNVPAAITSKPGIDSIRRDTKAVFTIEDFGTTVATSSVKLMANGSDVTAAASITKTADVITVSFPGDASLLPVGTHTYVLTATDSAGAPLKAEGTLRVNPYPAVGAFVIEAEDFDFGSGQSLPVADVMPYMGGAYKGLASVHDTDYHRPDAEGSNDGMYRATIAGGLSPNVPMSENKSANNRYSVDRGSYNVTANYSIGWGGEGRWYNYTRNIPTGSYEVWAAMSHDGRAVDINKSQLESVSGATVTVLGSMVANGTGGWGQNDLFPVLTSAGTPTIVSGGKQTLRWHETGEGDMDYLVLVPTSSSPAPTIGISGAGVINYTGTLTASDTVNGTFAPVSGATSPYTVPKTGAAKFYKSQQ